MSLRYIYELFENKTDTANLDLITSLLYQAGIKNTYCNICEFFKTDSHKQQTGKNPFGILLIEMTEQQLQKLIPDYIQELVVFDEDKQFFSRTDRSIIITIRETVSAIVNKDSFIIKLLLDKIMTNFKYNKSEVIEIFRLGHIKYGDTVYNKNPFLLVTALARHLYKFYNTELIDEETKCYHINHAACNLIMIYHIIEGEKKNV